MGQTFVQLREAIWTRHALKEHSRSGDFWPFVLQNLSSGEQALLLSSEFYVWYAEGGFDTFFFEGDNYKRAQATVLALRVIGMSQAANYLARAIQIVGIPEPVPPSYEYESPEPPNAALEQLEREYRQVRHDEMLELKSLEYLTKHPEEFA